MQFNPYCILMANVERFYKFHFFADGIIICFNDYSIADMFKVFTDELIIIGEWFKLNNMKLNVSKTNVMFLEANEQYNYFTTDNLNLRLTVLIVDS